MSHLPKVEFAADAPEALECITSLARCIISGEIVGCASEDPANMIRLVARVAAAGAERFFGPGIDPDAPVVIGDSPEDQAWADLCIACNVSPEAPEGTVGAAGAKSIPWNILLPILLQLLEAWLKDRK